jgi:WD40 repeat protein
MSSKLSVRYCFGVNSTACNNILGFADERLIVYVCGSQVVILNADTKEQSFIPGGRLGVSCISSSKKVLVVADKGDPSPLVTLYDISTLRKRKVLSYPEMGACDVKSVSLSEDGKLCAVQGGAPDWPIVLWNIEKSAKVMGSVRVPVGEDGTVLHVSFCPGDPSVIIALGKGVFKLFRVQEGQIRPVLIIS